MKVVYNWLKDFVDVTAPPDDLASRLALSGTNIAGVVKGLHGAVIDAEVSSNRPDCLSHYGMAREVGAIYQLPLKAVRPKPAESSAAKAADAVNVEIQAPELCGRFTARVIRDLKVQPSPPWLPERLEARRDPVTHVRGVLHRGYAPELLEGGAIVNAEQVTFLERGNVFHGDIHAVDVA